MKIDKRAAVRALVVGVLISAFGAGSYALAQFAIAQVNDDGHDYLRSNTRTRLMVCVDGALSAGADATDAGRVQQALDSALDSFPNVPEHYLDQLQLATDRLPDEYLTRHAEVGCPEPQSLVDPPVEREVRHSIEIGKILEDEGFISPYRVHVYMMTVGEFGVFFPDEAFATTAEETLCGGDVCEGVTRGLYLPRISAQDVLEEGLLFALNLLAVRASELEPQEIDWAACEPGGKPYPTLGCDDLEDWAQDICAGQEIEGPPPKGLNCSYWESR